jgi:hypothetical protein
MKTNAQSSIHANVFVDAEMVSQHRDRLTTARLDRNDCGGMCITQYREDNGFGPRIECREQRFGRWQTAYIAFATEDGMAKWKAAQQQVDAEVDETFASL